MAQLLPGATQSFRLACSRCNRSLRWCLSRLRAVLGGERTTLDKLPPEVLAHILSYLPPCDRLNSALTCKRWAQAVAIEDQLLEDVRLSIRGHGLEEAEAVLMRSPRRHRNLKLSDVALSSFNTEFWTRIGKNLRELELYECRWRPRVLFEILQKCPKLDSLILIREIEHPEDFEEIGGSSSNVRHFHIGSPLTGEMLAHLLGWIPKVTTLSLSMFDSESDFLDRLPCLLGVNRVIKALEFREDFNLDVDDRTKLIRLCSANLEELRNAGLALPKETYEAVCDCSRLRVLTLWGSRSFENDQLEKIVVNNPGLEELTLKWCESITDDGMVPIRYLKKLRRLDLSECESEISGLFLWSLRGISSLQHLEIQNFERSVSIPNFNVLALESIASLPKLRTLGVDCSKLESDLVEVIFEKFKHLRHLKLGDCGALKGEDFAQLREFEKLKSLDFRWGWDLSNEICMRGFAPSDLACLTLHGCSLTDKGLRYIGVHLNRLRAFQIISCGQVTEAGLLSLLEQLSLLERLEIGYNPITIEFPRHLEKLCPRLRTLSVHIDSSIKRSAMEAFKKQRPGIEVRLKSIHANLLTRRPLELPPPDYS